MASLRYFNASLVFQFSVFKPKNPEIKSNSFHLSILCSCFNCCFIKTASSPFQRRINISKSHYCAVVLWWLLCLHVVIMDSTNSSQNYHFSSLFLHIFQIHILTSVSSVKQLHFMVALPCTALVQFVKNSHYFGAELSVRFSVNLFKALLAIIARSAIFFPGNAIILGCICCFLWQPHVPSLQIDSSKIDLYYGLFICLTPQDLQHYILLPH